MTSRLTFMITCERCGKTDTEPARFEMGIYDFSDKDHPELELKPISPEEARENADLTFLMKGWAVANFGRGEKKGKIDLCPDCLKQWEELGDDFMLVPAEDSERTGYMLEFRYIEEEEKNDNTEGSEKEDA